MSSIMKQSLRFGVLLNILAVLFFAASVQAEVDPTYFHESWSYGDISYMSEIRLQDPKTDLNPKLSREEYAKVLAQPILDLLNPSPDQIAEAGYIYFLGRAPKGQIVFAKVLNYAFQDVDFQNAHYIVSP